MYENLQGNRHPIAPTSLSSHLAQPLPLHCCFCDVTASFLAAEPLDREAHGKDMEWKVYHVYSVLQIWVGDREAFFLHLLEPMDPLC